MYVLNCMLLSIDACDSSRTCWPHPSTPPIAISRSHLATGGNLGLASATAGNLGLVSATAGNLGLVPATAGNIGIAPDTAGEL